MFKRLPLVFACVALLASWSRLSAGVPHEDVDRLVRPLLDARVAPAVVVGIYRDGESHVFAYGEVEGGRAPTGRTLFEIGSITKGFTGLLLADAVHRGELGLDQPIDSVWPEGFKPPSFDAQSISFLHLATHRSGLPRLPTNMRADDLSDPYAKYSRDDLLSFLDGYRPARAPDEAYEYSNLGFGLLGSLLAERAGVSYERLLKERLTGPLGMKRTFVRVPPAERSRLAPGHRDGTQVPSWEFDALAGCGGVRSCADDMLLLVAALAHPVGSPIEDAATIATVPRRGVDGTPYRIGLAWQTAVNGTTAFHNGQTGGYSAMLMADPTVGVGVVILANGASSYVDAVGNQIMLSLLGGPVEPLPLVAPPEAEQLQRFEGEYATGDGGFVLLIAARNGVLTGQIMGQGSWATTPVSANTFTQPELGVEIEFDVPEEGPVESLTFRQGGATLTFKRR